MALIDWLKILIHWSFLLFVAKSMIFHQSQVNASSTDQLLQTIHRFLYNNEQLCGDPFEDHLWLPAQDKCEMECDMLTELCQESTQRAAIKAQRCKELPKQCVEALREELYGMNHEENDEVNDQSIENEISQFQKASDQPFHKGISVSGTTNEGSKIHYNDVMRPLKPFGLDVRLIKASGVSTFNLQSTTTPKPEQSSEELSNEEEPFSTLELLKDFGVNERTTKRPRKFNDDESLFNEILHTSTTSFIQSKLNEKDEENEANGRNELELDKSFIDKFFEDTFSDLNSLSNAPNDENLFPITIPPSPTLHYTTTTTQPSTTTTNTFITASHHDEQSSSFFTSNNVLEMTSNPFETMVGQPVGTISQQWPSGYHKTIDNRLEMPKEATLPPEVHIFGPPFSSRSPTHSTVMEMPSFPSQKAAPLNYQARDSSREQFEDEKPFGTNHFFPLSWKELANRLKKKPFYSLDDKDAIDYSPNCCQFALEGLCDRSHQRVRIMCPKSCGNVVCSSVDGALSCSRAINVDVIDCYEKRKYRSYGSTNQRRYQASAPTRKISTTTEDVSIEKNWDIQLPKHTDEKPAYLAKAPQSANSMLQRAYAIENEIRNFRNFKTSNK